MMHPLCFKHRNMGARHTSVALFRSESNYPQRISPFAVKFTFIGGLKHDDSESSNH